MKKIVVLFACVLCAFSISAQSNNPAPYCVGGYTTGCAERSIAGVLTAGASTNITNVSNGCGPFQDGYNYYCNHPLGTIAGQVVTFSIVPGGLGNSYSLCVHVDWNGDNTFSVPSEQLFVTGLTSSTSTFTFNATIPPAQPNGKYRLRVRLIQWGIGPVPCGMEQRGETEDYDVYVGLALPAPSAPVTVTATGNGSLCAGQTILLNANYTSTVTPTFSWIGPSSYTSALQNPTITNITTANSGYYSVSAFTGTCPVSAKVQVLVYATPNLTTSSSLGACAGSSQTLSVSGATSYVWSTSATGSITSVSPSVSTVYTVTGTNTQSCSSTQTVLANVFPVPQLTLSVTSPTICVGAQGTLTASGASSYTWSTSSNSASVVVSPSITSVYTVTASNGTCAATSTVMQSVSPCTGIDELEADHVSIGPNPFKEELVVTVMRSTFIWLLDLTGKAVWVKEVSGKSTIDTSQLPKGVYFICVNGAKPIKLIKD